MISRKFKYLGLVVVTLSALSAFYALKSFTPPIFSDNAVSELTSIEINGELQHLLIRGTDRNLPPLLFLHGGPGMPAMYLAHAFQRPLENEFVVVHWDQRGAGKSFHPDIDPESLSISQLISDTDELVDYLLAKFRQGKIWLVGHSHGSYLGALYSQRYPEKLYAYIGIGQIGDFERETEIQDAFLRDRLTDLGISQDTQINGANREELLFKTGSELYDETSFLPLIFTGLGAMEYNLGDILNVARGSSFSSANMTYDESRDLLGEVTDFSIPVAMIMGVHDMTTPVSLAEEYFQAISAPEKSWFMVEKAAHFPHYEQPQKFFEIMLELKEQWLNR